jgi:hypothetical protein
MHQALDVWADLEDAYAGDHKFGGDTAEIYAYRLTPYRPSVHHGLGVTSPWGSEQHRQLARDAAGAMCDLLELFIARREVEVEVNGERYGAHVRGWDFDHRWQVRVVHQ